MAQPTFSIQSNIASSRASGLAQIAIAASAFSLLLLGFHEGFGLGVVARIADAGSYWRCFYCARLR
jgi:hypothetical protein